MATKRKLVVIGNGMAGARAVEEILARGGADLFDGMTALAAELQGLATFAPQASHANVAEDFLAEGATMRGAGFGMALAEN